MTQEEKDRLHKAADEYANSIAQHDERKTYCKEDCFIAGAEWQKEQFEKNRLEHCDNITEEQYNLESNFVDSHIEKNNRIPTFLDAIEHGMQLGKEKTVEKSCEWFKTLHDGYAYNKSDLIEQFRKAMEE